MAMRCAPALLATVFTVCSLLAPSVEASMGLAEEEGPFGATTGRSPKTESKTSSKNGIQISLAVVGPEEGWDPVTQRGNYPVTLAFPVTFSGDLATGQRWKVCWDYSVNIIGQGTYEWEWEVEDDPPNPPYIVEGNPPAQHTYPIWGAYGVCVTVYLFDTEEDAYCRRGELNTTITAILPAPSEEDLDQLAPLVADGGMRDLIAASNRPEFVIGTAEYELFEIDARVWDRLACPLADEEFECEGEVGCATARNWGCDHPEGECCSTSSYCNNDPKILEGDDPGDPDWASLPLSISEVQDYIAAEFNALATEDAFCLTITGRKAELDNGALKPLEYYGFADKRVEFAEAHDLVVHGSSLIYSLPWWAWFVAQYGYGQFNLDAPALKDLLSNYLSDVMSHYNSEFPGRVATWPVVNELLPDDYYNHPDPQAPLQDLIKITFPGDTADRCGLKKQDKWPWYVLSGCPDPGGATEYAADALKDLYRDAREYAGENAKLMYNDGGVQFRYTGKPSERIDQPKFERAARLVELFQAADVPLDMMGFHMHITAWSCLARNGDNDVRLNPNQLKSIRDSFRYFGERGLETIITEMDVRIGIPDDYDGPPPENPCELMGGDPPLYNTERQVMVWHLGADVVNCDFTNPWDGFSGAQRQQWQGLVYEAVLNACLADPHFVGLYFWGIEDVYNWLDRRRNRSAWPYVPNYPDEASAQTCLFGDDPTTEDYCEVYYPKPAYYGVRRAIENYFGPAATVKDTADNEVLRFAANGNVLLMGKNAHVVENVSAFSPDEDTIFVVKNTAGYALLLSDVKGQHVLHLAGQVIENDDFELNGKKALKVLGCDAETVVSAVDEDGNLRMTGYLLVDGIPHCLKPYEQSDEYFRW